MRKLRTIPKMMAASMPFFLSSVHFQLLLSFAFLVFSSFVGLGLLYA